MKPILLVLLCCFSFVSQAQFLNSSAGKAAMPLKEHDKLLHLATYGPNPSETANKTTNGGIFDTTAWAQAIDSHWGAGLPAADKLDLFNNYWNHVDTAYPCFMNLPLYNWDSIVTAKRNEIGGGVSRGRFAGIIGNLMTYLNDGHSTFYDVNVNYAVSITPGLPVFRGQSGRFGACITALDDSIAMVYEAVPNHPLGLERGDIILGYNGIPWSQLVQTILRHELPNSVYKGSTDIATWRRYVKAAGENWYLFDTINIQKCDGSIVNLDVSVMNGASFQLFCSDQLPVPGVPRLSYNDIYSLDRSYSSGVITGTHIGYVYMYDCGDMSGDSLYSRVKTLVEDSAVQGLILDIRTNFGGSFRAFTKTFRYLHDGFVSWIGYGERDDPANRYSLSNTGLPSSYDIDDTDPHYSNIPLAILTGSEAVSAGDLLPVQFKHHQQSRTFGQSTAGAYGALDQVPVGYPGYGASVQMANFFEVNDPTHYLTHTEYPVDQPTWLDRDSVCAGKDNVVTEALNWIQSAAAIVNIPSAKPRLDIYPNPAHETVSLRINTLRASEADVLIHDPVGKLVFRSKQSLSAGETRLVLQPSLLPGVYVLTVSGNSSCEVRQKLVIR